MLNFGTEYEIVEYSSLRAGLTKGLAVNFFFISLGVAPKALGPTNAVFHWQIFVQFFVYISKNPEKSFHWANIPVGVKSERNF